MTMAQFDGSIGALNMLPSRSRAFSSVNGVTSLNSVNPAIGSTQFNFNNTASDYSRGLGSVMRIRDGPGVSEKYTEIASYNQFDTNENEELAKYEIPIGRPEKSISSYVPNLPTSVSIRTSKDMHNDSNTRIVDIGNVSALGGLNPSAVEKRTGYTTLLTSTASNSRYAASTRVSDFKLNSSQNLKKPIESVMPFRSRVPGVGVADTTVSSTVVPTAASHQFRSFDDSFSFKHNIGLNKDGTDIVSLVLNQDKMNESLRRGVVGTGDKAPDYFFQMGLNNNSADTSRLGTLNNNEYGRSVDIDIPNIQYEGMRNSEILGASNRAVSAQRPSQRLQSSVPRQRRNSIGLPEVVRDSSVLASNTYFNGEPDPTVQTGLSRRAVEDQVNNLDTTIGTALNAVSSRTSKPVSNLVSMKESPTCVCSANRYMARLKAHCEHQLRRIEAERSEFQQRQEVLQQRELQVQQQQTQGEKRLQEIQRQEVDMKRLQKSTEEEREQMKHAIAEQLVGLEVAQQELQRQTEEFHLKQARWDSMVERKKVEVTEREERQKKELLELEILRKDIESKKVELTNRQGKLETESYELASEQQQLHEKHLKLERLSADLNSRKQLCEDMIEKLRNQEVDMKRKDGELRRRDAELIRMSNELNQKHDEYTKTENNLLSRQKDLDQKEMNATRKEQELNMKEDELQRNQHQLDESIEQKQAEWRSKQAKLDHERQDLKRRQEEMAGFELELKQHQKDLQGKEEQLKVQSITFSTELEGERNQFLAECAKEREKIAALKREVDASCKYKCEELGKKKDNIDKIEAELQMMRSDLDNEAQDLKDRKMEFEHQMERAKQTWVEERRMEQEQFEAQIRNFTDERQKFHIYCERQNNELKIQVGNLQQMEVEIKRELEEEKKEIDRRMDQVSEKEKGLKMRENEINGIKEELSKEENLNAMKKAELKRTENKLRNDQLELENMKSKIENEARRLTQLDASLKKQAKELERLESLERDLSERAVNLKIQEDAFKAEVANMNMDLDKRAALLNSAERKLDMSKEANARQVKELNDKLRQVHTYEKVTNLRMNENVSKLLHGPISVPLSPSPWTSNTVGAVPQTSNSKLQEIGMPTQKAPFKTQKVGPSALARRTESRDIRFGSYKTSISTGNMNGRQNDIQSNENRPLDQNTRLYQRSNENENEPMVHSSGFLGDPETGRGSAATVGSTTFDIKGASSSRISTCTGVNSYNHSSSSGSWKPDIRIPRRLSDEANSPILQYPSALNKEYTTKYLNSGDDIGKSFFPRSPNQRASEGTAISIVSNFNSSTLATKKLSKLPVSNDKLTDPCPRNRLQQSINRERQKQPEDNHIAVNRPSTYEFSTQRQVPESIGSESRISHMSAFNGTF